MRWFSIVMSLYCLRRKQTFICKYIRYWSFVLFWRGGGWGGPGGWGSGNPIMWKSPTITFVIEFRCKSVSCNWIQISVCLGLWPAQIANIQKQSYLVLSESSGWWKSQWVVLFILWKVRSQSQFDEKIQSLFDYWSDIKTSWGWGGPSSA